MAERAFHETPAADACYLVGGGVLLASAFLHWVARGTGSGLRGHDLVDAVVALGREVPLLSTGRLTILWYLVPTLGTASWIACGLSGAHSRASRVIAGAAIVVTAIVGAAFIHFVGFDRLGRRVRRSRCSVAWCSASRPGGRVARSGSAVGAVAAHLLERPDRVQALVVGVERRRRSSRR